MKKTKVIAEVGCNHKGDMEIAREMIFLASTVCKADYVKFQKRNNRELLTEEEYNTPHPVPANSYGSTYGEHREFLEFDVDQHKQLQKWCAEAKIGYSTSVWDLTSAKEIVQLAPDFIKIPSACNLNFELLQELSQNYEGDIHISLGMTKKEEIEEIVVFLEKNNAAKRTVLYSCTSGYPVPFEDICLLEVVRLNEHYKDRVKEIAFSGHHLGIAADIAAMTLGATWIERHFTLDRTWKGTDHAASLEVSGLLKLCRDVKNVGKALTYKREDILPIEGIQRDKLKAASIKRI
ncbi:MAG: N-acetylneuraminate synthase family protein [Bdellovibrionota bacterium]